ncbi:DUF397 domain-containing protein [Streptomyces sp. ISL-66]|uniref:DUF397 domain-containing protein n=1 Tax=Streptomyces sp. ISL-66 TaxID=2819186 RepID=UPI001BE7FDDF|nr:DUF397 domain-containing protein [Streptomyces sp. ISL-66]MBT2469544.1 DUF397 domain-containing protein [Streptomyces sp. ISL-66]
MTGIFANGIAADSISGAVWRKASASNPFENCVEFAQLADGEVAVRNSRFPGGPALVFTPSEVIAFLDGAKKGEFDGMTV